MCNHNNKPRVVKQGEIWRDLSADKRQCGRLIEIILVEDGQVYTQTLRLASGADPARPTFGVTQRRRFSGKGGGFEYVGPREEHEYLYL